MRLGWPYNRPFRLLGGVCDELERAQGVLPGEAQTSLLSAGKFNKLHRPLFWGLSALLRWTLESGQYCLSIDLCTATTFGGTHQIPVAPPSRWNKFKTSSLYGSPTFQRVSLSPPGMIHGAELE